MLQCVPQRHEAAGTSVRRVVALHHATFGAERLDGRFDVGLPGRGQFEVSDGVGALFEAEAPEGQTEPADLADDVGATSHIPLCIAPLVEDSGATLRVHFHSHYLAQMVEHYGHVRESVGDFGDVGQLMVEYSGFIGQSARCHLPKGRSEPRVLHQARWGRIRHVAQHCLAGVLDRYLTNAAKSLGRDGERAIE